MKNPLKTLGQVAFDELNMGAGWERMPFYDKKRWHKVARVVIRAWKRRQPRIDNRLTEADYRDARKGLRWVK